MKKIFVSLICASLCTLSAIAQGSGAPLVEGYAKYIAGSKMPYNEVLKGQRDAMIIRANDVAPTMEWESAAVPEGVKGAMVDFLWYSGYELGKNINYQLVVNGRQVVKFTNSIAKTWSVTGDDGITLSFKAANYDREKNPYGQMVLRVPTKLLTAGQPIRLSLSSEDQGRPAWFMTYMTELSNKLIATAPAALKADGSRPINVNIRYLGDPKDVVVTLDGRQIAKTRLTVGDNMCQSMIQSSAEPQTAKIEVKGRDYSMTETLTIEPVRKWEVNFVEHSHTDIGYTRPQTEIMGEHLRYIDYALDYCDITDNYPDAAKFRWTCETAWAVDEWLNCRPKEQVDRFIKRVKEGRIEVTAMYLNFDELPDEQVLAASMAPMKRFRELGLPFEVAMQNDVNGIGWCFTEFFPDMGIKYLNMGINIGRALPCFDRPTMFWWESPSGKRMMAFHGEHYMTGNFFGIEAGDFDAFESKFLTYLQELGAKGYPYDIMSIHHSGYFTDNSPPSTNACEIIRQWNEKYEWPKVRTSSSKEFFHAFEDRYGSDIPVIRGAWPDWWTDGFGTGARETAKARIAHTESIAVQGGLTMATMLGAAMPAKIDDRINEMNKALLFYDEHTYGADVSISDPYGTSTMEQRSLKYSYAWEAFRRSRTLGEEVSGLLQNYVPKAEHPSFVVFNTMSQPRSGLATAYIDYEIIPLTKNFKIVDSKGQELKNQMLDRRSDGAYWGVWAENVPALGYSQYYIIVDDSERVPEKTSAELTHPIVENQWYKMTLNPQKASIKSLWDKQLNREILTPDAKYQMGEYIYEQIANHQFGDAHEIGKHTRDGLDSLRFAGYSAGKVWDTYRFVGSTKAGIGKESYSVEFRIYNVAKRIDVTCSIRKKDILDAEGIYIAFPFELAGGKISADVPGGIMEIAKDQIPGSTTDWNTVQNFATVQSSDGQIVIGSNEVPLMQFGAINTGRYKYNAKPESTNIYGWPMNNYWTTNFSPDQRGMFTWTYYITSSADNSTDFATRFGWESRIPFIVRVLPEGQATAKGFVGSLMTIGQDNLLMVNLSPIDGKSALMQIRETAGKSVDMTAVSSMLGSLKCEEYDALGGPKAGGSLTFKPWETKFIKISWN